MKTRTLTILIVAFFSTISLSAQQKEVNIQYKVDTTDSGVVKEFTIFDKKNSEPVKKIVYYYDEQNCIEKRVFYRFDTEGQWIAVKKIEYTYNRENNPTLVVLTAWDNNTGDWSDKFEQLAYSYDDKKILMTTSMCENENEQLITQR